MRNFHFLDAVCLFVVAAFILLKTDASPKTPASLKLTLGNHWNSKSDACHADLTLSMPVQSSDKSKGLLVVKHKTGQSKKHSSVFAKQPIPKTSSGIFYYEVQIKRKAGMVAIGLCKKDFPLDEDIASKSNYVYHSSGLFMSSVLHKVDSNGKDIPPISADDVVGCGVDLANKKIFYTLNKKRLDPVVEFVDSAVELYPCVSLSKDGNEMEANFGPDFEFKKLLKWDE